MKALSIRNQLSTAPTWKTQTGQVLNICDMATSHIFYCVRMLWNHHLPTSDRLEPYVKYNLAWSKEYVIEKLFYLLTELQKRPKEDLNLKQQAELAFMLQRYIIKHDLLSTKDKARLGLPSSSNEYDDQ